MRKIFLSVMVVSNMIITTQVYSDTGVNIDNHTPYCGQVMIQYGPVDHPAWNVNNLAFVSNAEYGIGHINDINNFPDYILGVVQLQSTPCDGAHFPRAILCYSNNAKNVYSLPDSFTVHLSTDNKGSLKCSID